jgi:hypothetical protein
LHKKSKIGYEKYLNDLYYGQDISGFPEYQYLLKKQLLQKGKLGTVLRKDDPIAFEIGFSEWKGE